ncbi:hypothetical protein HKX48_008834 [Thoreauomyces humboldtii]|nr:hypothetical protein HKX48_008834 [Thoreauomyces humboldtii]
MYKCSLPHRLRPLLLLGTLSDSSTIMHSNRNINSLVTASLILLGSVGIEAQYVIPGGYPLPVTGMTIVQSPVHPNVTLSYKQTSICETTHGVRGYSGYIHLPPNTLTSEEQPYPINSFFWFFEARNNAATAPTSFYLQGGPGASSMYSVFQESGPCHILRDGTAELNPWSWNQEANMIYLDQPVGAGFSYVDYSNVTLYQTPDGTFTDQSQVSDMTQALVQTGTLAGLKGADTVSSTAAAAEAAWHFAQAFFAEFPHYNANAATDTAANAAASFNASSPLHLSIFTESYGGHYGPGFSTYWEMMNEGIRNGTVHQSAFELHLEALGIINGCIDVAVQGPPTTEMLYNNTYGIQMITEQQYQSSMKQWTMPGGALDQYAACQKAIAAGHGASAVCLPAMQAANLLADKLYYGQNRGTYDFAAPAADPFPQSYLFGYLNSQEVQAALGVPLNWTSSSEAVGNAFGSTFNFEQGGLIDDLAYILSRGVRVALIYGDRDYICNWYGGEAVSKTINYGTPTASLSTAGYTNMVTNATYNGGLTRQYGNLSFTRVFEAGHEVPAYQPETAYQIFDRVMRNVDVATGTIDLSKTPSYSTTGPLDSFGTKNVLPAKSQPECYVLDMSTCTLDQQTALLNGSSVVVDYIVVGSVTKGRGGSGTAKNSAHVGKGGMRAGWLMGLVGGLCIGLLFGV